MHPGTRFIRAKSEEEQDMDHLLGRRERLVHCMTQVVNQTRSYLAEKGIVIPQGKHQFMKNLPQIISAKWDSFSGDFQAVLTENFADYEELAVKIEQLDAIINARAVRTDDCKRLMQISGIGPLTAVALVAHVGDAKQFENGRQMSAFLGLTPREHSSGGKQRLLGITKRGNIRLRTLLILGARAAILGIERRKKGENGEPLKQPSSLDRWILALKEKKGIFKTAVALANKIARMAWVLLAKGEKFDLSKACVIKTV
jgi:transposase